MCDPNVVQIILTFVIGGITLKTLISLVKNYLKLNDLGATLLSIVMCACSSALYLLIVGPWSWICFLLYTAQVFIGSKFVYEATK